MLSGELNSGTPRARRRARQYARQYARRRSGSGAVIVPRERENEPLVLNDLAIDATEPVLAMRLGGIVLCESIATSCLQNPVAP
jgi:hypothetical protein